MIIRKKYIKMINESLKYGMPSKKLARIIAIAAKMIGVDSNEIEEFIDSNNEVKSEFDSMAKDGNQWDEYDYANEVERIWNRVMYSEIDESAEDYSNDLENYIQNVGKFLYKKREIKEMFSIEEVYKVLREIDAIEEYMDDDCPASSCANLIYDIFVDTAAEII